jgi:hypothetical protein
MVALRSVLSLARHVALVVSVLGLVAGAAHAASIQQHVDLDYSGGGIGDGSCGASLCTDTVYHNVPLYEVDGFDPSLGTLESVTLALSSVWSWSAEERIDAGWFPPSFSVRSSVVFAGGTLSQSTSFVLDEGACAGVPVGDDCLLAWEAPLERVEAVFEDELEDFVGLGPRYAVEFDGLYRRQGMRSDDTYPGLLVSLDVTYHYVPEPGTALLLVLAIAAAGDFRARPPGTPRCARGGWSGLTAPSSA